MPLTGSESVLSAAFRTVLLADPEINAVDDVGLTAMCDALASVMIAHIVANAVVLPTLLVVGAAPGPVTGTGTIS